MPDLATPMILRLDEVRRLVQPADALARTREALVAHYRGLVANPPPWHLDVAEAGGEVHVKGAHMRGRPNFAIKMSTAFPTNADRALPTASGLVAVFDSATGGPVALLLDQGYLTELRTGAAGALATDALARPDVDTVTVVGTGGQARYQLRALLDVRRPTRLIIAGRTRERAEALADWAATVHGWHIEITTDVGRAVSNSDVVVTVTTATQPVVAAEHLRPGTHITAIGADSPGKRELDPDVLQAAATIAVDDIGQSRTLGELKTFTDAQITALPVRPLGGILAGEEPGRRSTDEITVADLTGLGAQDTALADYVVAQALATRPEHNDT